MGYPTVKISAFLVFDTIPECDRQTNGQTDKRTDGRICRSIGLYSACKASFAERCKRVEFFFWDIVYIVVIVLFCSSHWMTWSKRQNGSSWFWERAYITVFLKIRILFRWLHAKLRTFSLFGFSSLYSCCQPSATVANCRWQRSLEHFIVTVANRTTVSTVSQIGASIPLLAMAQFPSTRSIEGVSFFPFGRM